MQPTTVVVAGDLLLDYNLAQLPHGPAHHHEPVQETLFASRPGGAWYLSKLVEMSCSDVVPAARVSSPRCDPDLGKSTTSSIASAYSLWRLLPRVVGAEKGDEIWRIEKFLGCHAPEELAAVPIERDVADPDVLVLDDLNLGFRNAPHAWPRALRDRGKPRRIVLKTVAPLGEGKLWEHLMSDDRADRLTVVIAAAAIREQRGQLSKRLSWDLAIEEVTAEITRGASRSDLGRCRRVVIVFGSEGAACFTRRRLCYGKDAKSSGTLAPDPRLERFVFLPAELEGTRHRKYPGMISGGTSVLAASLVRHEIDPNSYPLFFGLGRGLAAVSKLREVGAGNNVKDLEASPEKVLLNVLHHRPQPKRSRKRKEPLPDPAAAYRSAFPRELLNDDPRNARADGTSNLLDDATGHGLEYVLAHASNVVFRGAHSVLADVPRAEFGAFLTFDRQEIERLNAIRGLIEQYRENRDEVRPLSIAVFGPPGSGKSFAIKQLAKDLFGKEQTTLEFNLSQFEPGSTALHEAFHQVRDASVRGRVPLVFWDEFDADQLRWLKEFLAPMQDAEFRVGSITHPLGKAIFVFAGGVSSTFDAFQQPRDRERFVLSKGPDFVSRLRGFLNVKGPNPSSHSGRETPGTDTGVAWSWAELAERDASFAIRRAVMLRSAIERTAKHLIDPESEIVSISAAVVHAFLRVRCFRHGARSLEAVVTMSSLARSQYFAISDLPSADQLLLHVTPDFLDHLREGELEAPVVEFLAEACHETWKRHREANRWKRGETRDDTKRINPLLVPYQKLDAADKERRNRSTARLVRAKVAEVGYVVRRRLASHKTLRSFTSKEENRLAELEHDIWMRSHLLNGYEWGPRTNEHLRLHADIAPLEEIAGEDQAIDGLIVRSIPDALWRKGYLLMKVLRIGVTGHRILTDEDKIEWGVDQVLQRIAEKFPDRPLLLISPLAEGADRLVVRRLLAVPGARLEVSLPMPRQEYVQDFEWGEEERQTRSKEEFQSLIDRADRVFELPAARTREEAYDRVGRYVVDHCDLLIAVWDGKGAQGKGGTGSIIARARRQRLPMAWVHAGNRKPGSTEATSLGTKQGTVTFERFA